MKTTANYGLRKPEDEDFYSIADFNLNADIVDTHIFEKASKPETPTAGNLAALNAQGNLLDSGKNPRDFLEKSTKPADIGAEPAGAAAQVESRLGVHMNDNTKHFSAAEKLRLASALTTADIVVSGTQPPVQEGRVWIKL